MLADTHDTSALPAAAGEALFQGLALKMLVIDAICGVGFPTHLIAGECERTGLAKFTGNQWNPAWEWSRNALARNELPKLQALYEALCEARHDAARPAATAGKTSDALFAGLSQ